VGTPVTPRAASSPTVQRPPSVPISKWNVKYSGDDRDMSLSAFLARVEELMVARHATKQDLFDCAIDLFSGKALIWYRANRKNATDWNSLVTLLRGQFQPADYNDRLFDEIRQRTQGSDETIGLYLAVMDSLFDRTDHQSRGAGAIKDHPPEFVAFLSEPNRREVFFFFFWGDEKRKSGIETRTYRLAQKRSNQSR
jgi:hypothetical protein